MIKMKTNFIFSILLVLFVFNAIGQEKYSLSVQLDNELQIEYDSVHSDSLKVFQEIEVFQTKLKARGYISSYYRFSMENDSNVVCHFTVGEKYIWKNLTVSNLINQIAPSIEDFSTKTFNENKLKSEVAYLLEVCEDNGYPFAQVFFDSVMISEGEIEAKLDVSLNDFVIVDSIIVKGGMKTSLNYVTKQIGIEKGDVYNEGLIDKINIKVSNIPFVETIRTSEVYFTKGKATLVLYLKDKTASRFDGIIGLNPDEGTGKIGITGDLKVDLLNAFKKGENIILNWEQAKSESQNYLARFSYPFLFSSRIGLETGLNYYRQDSTFANLDADFGFSFFLDEKQKAGVSAQVIESNSLLASQASLAGLPVTNSARTIYYGVNYSYNSLDYRLNPRRGLSVLANLKTGNKTIVKDADLVNLEYENLEEKTIQIKTDVTVSYFLPLFKKSTVLLKLHSGNVFGDNIFLNELYQLGGLKTIRGFNQQSILASNFYIATSEFRYLFDRNSAVFGYLDYAYYESKSTTGFETDVPFGFGVGTNFQTKAGIFSLSYGLGKQKGNPILFKNGKVHFGFVSLF